MASVASARQPWEVGLRHVRLGHRVCGASLVNSRFAVTAASCVDGESPGDLRVRTHDDLLELRGDVPGLEPEGVEVAEEVEGRNAQSGLLAWADSDVQIQVRCCCCPIVVVAKLFLCTLAISLGWWFFAALVAIFVAVATVVLLPPAVFLMCVAQKIFSKLESCSLRLEAKY